MGTQDRGLRSIRTLNKVECERQAIQKNIDLSKNLDIRRCFGQFSTPFGLAEEIVSYGLSLSNTKDIKFLEPAVGTGVFFSALMKNIIDTDKTIDRMTGIEIDSEYFTASYKLWHDYANVVNGDFTRCQPNEQYNLVITNPPYVRHHLLTQQQKNFLDNAVKNEVGTDLSGLSGLYCYFLLLTHKWLSPGAICGWLLPSEFMDVNYGEALKKYLLDTVHLLRIHRYDPDDPKFADALVSSCVVWFKNEKVDFDYDVEFSYSGTHKEPYIMRTVKKSVLTKERKWTRFPQKEIRITERKKTTIGDYFTIKRGLATGDNNFFILDKEKINDLGLDMKFFKPILPSPRYLKTDFVQTDNDGIPQIERQYFLLDCDLPESDIERKSPTLWKYLQSGIETTSKKYLCKSRRKWYLQEHRNATHFLCSYMGRGVDGETPIRFILNLSDAVVTNSYLMLYPKESLQQAIASEPQIVFRIWNALKSIQATEIEDEGRVYGGGLKKIEPKELAKVTCDDLENLCSI